jgi:hypothetical protein
MISLNGYLTELIADPNNRYTASDLKVSRTLCQHFCQLLTLSDQNVREYGCSLDWVNNKLTAGNQRFDGPPSGNAVDLQTLTERQRAAYIGSFHTHPYERKYGQGIWIGPSNGDWEEWWRRPPGHQTVAAHFVASGGELFLIVFRTLPAGQLAQDNVTSDTQRLNDAIRNWSDKDQVKWGEAEQHRRWDDMRALLRQNSPKAISQHQADAHQMNCDIAKKNAVEYYKGPLLNAASTLTLASDRVLGNFFTSAFWKKKTDPWIG